MQLSKILARFETKYIPEPSSGCWLWEGAVWMGKRYGAFWIDKFFNKGRMTSAHRASIFLYKGIDPKGMEVCHVCDNTLCVNPNHLFLGTHQDNMIDMVKKDRHVCVKQKLTSSQIEEAKIMRKNLMQVKDIADVFGISRSHMSRIVAGILPRNTVCQ